MPPEADTTTTTETETPPVETPPVEETKPDPPKETDWKSEARKWEQRAKDNMKALNEAKPKLAEYDKQVEANKTELQKAQDAATQAEEQSIALALRAVKAEVRSRAVGFVHTDVPFAYLDASEFFDDKGEIDTTKIDAELADLLVKHPELAKPPASRVPGHNPALGSSASGEPDPEAQKAAAMKAGDWKTVMRLENQKLNAPTQ